MLVRAGVENVLVWVSDTRPPSAGDKIAEKAGDAKDAVKGAAGKVGDKINEIKK